MTTYRPLPNDGVDLAATCGARGADVLPGPHTGDYTPMGFWAQNGSMSQPLGESSAATTRPSPTTPAMPKMGVRARVADWPPKREALRELNNPSPSQDADGAKATTKVTHSLRSLQNGPASTTSAPVASGSRAFHRLSRRRSKDVEFQDGWPRSPGRAFLPLRHRSSSEITLSECDAAAEDPGAEARGARLAGALPLFREYGSTSSIDVQAVPEQSFFDILNEFRSEQPDAVAAAAAT
ncbi:PREDICTED: signal-induced proliferation-associated 1-like protein 3, partial [Dipodomys ordii]|uniref:Signal-induced proliferation-associated 1-like protein 3 n=1 Tax=Dipodomys ordii TaxID=10020 RepID=A0A1S3GW00_DIPOR